MTSRIVRDVVVAVLVVLVMLIGVHLVQSNTLNRRRLIFSAALGLLLMHLGRRVLNRG